MKKALILIMAFLLCGCGYSPKSTTEDDATEDFTTAAEKSSEIDTEQATEASYRQVTETVEIKATTEIATEEPATQASYEDPGKIVFSSERKTAERVAVSTEETTGEINEDGYGWVQLQYSATYHICDDHLTRSNGVVYYAGHRETWYSTNEKAGQATAREIPGKHIAEDGTIRDEDGYICVASSDLPFYEIVMTSVGPGKVYDCGCSSGTIDVYTNW